MKNYLGMINPPGDIEFLSCASLGTMEQSTCEALFFEVQLFNVSFLISLSGWRRGLLVKASTANSKDWQLVRRWRAAPGKAVHSRWRSVLTHSSCTQQHFGLDSVLSTAWLTHVQWVSLRWVVYGRNTMTFLPSKGLGILATLDSLFPEGCRNSIVCSHLILCPKWLLYQRVWEISFHRCRCPHS